MFPEDETVLNHCSLSLAPLREIQYICHLDSMLQTVLEHKRIHAATHTYIKVVVEGQFDL